MNRAHLTMAVLGLGACLALTMLMGHLLSLNPGAGTSGPVADRFRARFGRLLEKPARIVVRHVGEGGEPGVEVVARVRPKATVDVDRMVADMGDFLWHSGFPGGRLRSVAIHWHDPSTGLVSRMRLQRPGARPALPLYGPRSAR